MFAFHRKIQSGCTLNFLAVLRLRSEQKPKRYRCHPVYKQSFEPQTGYMQPAGNRITNVSHLNPTLVRNTFFGAVLRQAQHYIDKKD